jgi:hypothetical protein
MHAKQGKNKQHFGNEIAIADCVHAVPCHLRKIQEFGNIVAIQHNGRAGYRT